MKAILNCDIPFHLASYNDNNQIKSLYRYNHLALIIKCTSQWPRRVFFNLPCYSSAIETFGNQKKRKKKQQQKKQQDAVASPRNYHVL